MAPTEWNMHLVDRKSGKCGRKFAKNSGRAQVWPVLERKLSRGFGIGGYQNYRPKSLKSREIMGQNFEFNPKYPPKGRSPALNFCIFRNLFWSAIKAETCACLTLEITSSVVVKAMRTRLIVRIYRKTPIIGHFWRAPAQKCDRLAAIFLSRLKGTEQ